ncbi:beta-ketoacyl synthase N-terminal-like domain-containing protein [Sphingobacterium sp.]|uniref:beta-ketoacyl synthase N-terminal-like domain-containing protein n=1 Tax=Sphingobacterium sp. TaxID=341027 RepID=UPI00258BAB30|nr:beta-ketoacyl synthase N-terminal-like domain-containing protein [Sphingobacterium sp.]WET69195.1 MAG: beta-ketoacyl synthase N-terminal-like domain-containing protein [Sphingobacterium sp.]
MKKVYLGPYNCVSPIGNNLKDTWNALVSGKSGIKLTDFAELHGDIYAAIVEEEQLDQHLNKLLQNTQLPFDAAFSKLEKLMIAALVPLVKAVVITQETELIVSTTKGNIAQCAGGANDIVAASLPVLAQKIADFFGFKRPPIIISNACVSGLQAISTAKRLIQMDYCKDAIIVAGDLVSEFVVSGFKSFQALSNTVCKPYDEFRQGLNLGEAAAAIHVTGQQLTDQEFFIAGEASINDANHISGPSRTGEGLRLSIASALAEAKLEPKSVDFICAHGTATIYNDEMEAMAIHHSGLATKPINSLKGYFGHTLGTAGLIESIISLECLRNNLLLPSLGYQKQGTSLPLAVVTELLEQPQPLIRCLKTASGFAGTNTAVLFERELR